MNSLSVKYCLCRYLEDHYNVRLNSGRKSIENNIFFLAFISQLAEKEVLKNGHTSPTL